MDEPSGRVGISCVSCRGTPVLSSPEMSWPMDGPLGMADAFSIIFHMEFLQLICDLLGEVTVMLRSA
jgi:hypothetical protein